MDSNNQQIAIIGGGLTGLAAAFYLQRKIEEEHLPYRVVLIESSDRLGGKMQTVERDGFVIERGPDSFLARKKSMTQLAKDVGIEGTIVPNSTGQSYILIDDELLPIPGGAVMGIPTEISPFIKSRLFSPAGKVRAAMDLVLPRSKETGDQPLGPFLRRRLGDEVVENLVEPLMSGIYAGDLDQLSILSTFPDMLETEQKHRSLILGTKKNRSRKEAPKTEKDVKKTDHRIGMFRTFEKGLQSLINAIEAQLPPEMVRKNLAVESVTKQAQGYTIELSNGEIMQAAAMIVTTPHQAIPHMFPDYSFFKPFQHMPSTSVATVSLAFDEQAVKQDINGTGFVVSRNSPCRITACTWTHKKWPHSTPKGKVLLRCYVGRPGDEGVVDLSDEEIVQLVLKDLNHIMNITEEPQFSVVSRWREAMPQYKVGHISTLRKVESLMNVELPGVYLAGASHKGVGMPDCIDQGVAAVGKVLNHMKQQANVEKELVSMR